MVLLVLLEWPQTTKSSNNFQYFAWQTASNAMFFPHTTLLIMTLLMTFTAWFTKLPALWFTAVPWIWLVQFLWNGKMPVGCGWSQGNPAALWIDCNDMEQLCHESDGVLVMLVPEFCVVLIRFILFRLYNGVLPVRPVSCLQLTNY